MESQHQNPEFRDNPENFHQCAIEFIKLVWEKAIKCSASLAFYLFSSTHLINLKIHECL